LRAPDEVNQRTTSPIVDRANYSAARGLRASTWPKSRTNRVSITIRTGGSSLLDMRILHIEFTSPGIKHNNF
jgi:hypothetical protein